jgi:hypothetical protein
MSVANEGNAVTMSDYKQTRDAAGRVRSQYSQMLQNLNDDDLAKQLRETTHMYQTDCELKMKCAARIDELEAKLQHQTYLIEQLFHLLDKKGETDDGRVFHPNELRSCRAADTEKLSKILAELRSPMKVQKDEWKCPINRPNCEENCGNYGCGN